MHLRSFVLLVPDEGEDVYGAAVVDRAEDVALDGVGREVREALRAEDAHRDGWRGRLRIDAAPVLEGPHASACRHEKNAHFAKAHMLLTEK